ncbi:MAG: hypothetical protein LH616_18945 [Ilumatobacteraceae bacterium]|nr:hypothetical protein [Ilumatobacteraceae bacterium]
MVSIVSPDRAWPAIDVFASLGAQRVDVGHGPDVSWFVLADPEGNEFCLLARSVQQL